LHSGERVIFAAHEVQSEVSALGDTGAASPRILLAILSGLDNLRASLVDS
jgi:hypothetical protein